MAYSLTHADLITLVRLFAPQISKKGVCEGVTKMWVQALLTSPQATEDFYKRLSETIPTYFEKQKYSFKKLKSDIKALFKIQKNPETRRPFTQSERDLIEIRSFCEAVALHQDVSAIKVVANIFQGDPILYPLTTSETLETERIFIESQGVGVLAPTLEELMIFFEDLEILLKAHPNDPVIFSLKSDNHAIGMYFNLDMHQWCVFNVNFRNKSKPFTTPFSMDPSQCINPDTCTILPKTYLRHGTLPEKEHVYMEKTSKTLSYLFLDPSDSTQMSNIIFPLISSNEEFTDRQLLAFALDRTSQSTGPFYPPDVSLKHFIFSSFFNQEHPHTLFQMTAYFNKRPSLLLNRIQQLSDEFAPLIHSRINSRGVSPLELASSWGQLRSVQALIEAHASVNGTPGLYATPLIRAAQCGHFSIVKALVQAKANPNLAINGMSALSLAQKYHHGQLINFLQDIGSKKTLTSQWYQYRMKQLPLSSTQEQHYAIGVVQLIGQLELIQSAYCEIRDSFPAPSNDDLIQNKVERCQAIQEIWQSFQNRSAKIYPFFTAQNMTEMMVYAIHQVFSADIADIKTRLPSFKKNAHLTPSMRQRRAIYTEQEKARLLSHQRLSSLPLRA